MRVVPSKTRVLSTNDALLTTATTMRAAHTGEKTHNDSVCKECIFEREKRSVTQKAFERALGISIYLMEEIEKLQVT